MIAAYFTFLLILIASGLAVICLGVFSIALCEATSWLWFRARSGFVQHHKSALVHH